MAIRHARLPGKFGAKIEGLDVRTASDQDLSDILDLLMEQRFVALTGQHLSHDEYLAFGRRWGQPVLLVARTSQLASHPEIIGQSNQASTPEFARNAANHWHSDSSYEEQVATFTMIYGVESPIEGGETRFADTVAAYQSMPKAKKKTCDELLIRHALTAATRLPDEHIPVRSKHPPEHAATIRQLDPVVHPLVRQHPVNGRRALYGLGGSCYGIVGMDEQEGSDMLLDLRRYASSSQFTSGYKLMPGDILLWDNFSVLHRATPIEYSDEPGKRRLNYRISVKGVPGFVSCVQTSPVDAEPAGTSG